MLWGTCQLSKPQKQSMGDNAMESNTAFVNNRPRITRGLKKSIDRFVKYRYGLYFSFKWCNEARYHLMLCCKKCISLPSHTKKGFPGGSSGKDSTCQCRRHGAGRSVHGSEDPPEEDMATRSSIPAWEVPWTEEPGGWQSMDHKRVGYDLLTEHHHHTKMASIDREE